MKRDTDSNFLIVGNNTWLLCDKQWDSHPLRSNSVDWYLSRTYPRVRNVCYHLLFHDEITRWVKKDSPFSSSLIIIDQHLLTFCSDRTMAHSYRAFIDDIRRIDRLSDVLGSHTRSALPRQWNRRWYHVDRSIRSGFTRWHSIEELDRPTEVNQMHSEREYEEDLDLVEPHEETAPHIWRQP